LGANLNMPSPFAPQTRPPMAGARTSSSQSVPSTVQPGNFRPRPGTRGPPPDPRYQQRPPISQLPPTLTDEQLALMDSVTREAIDERLRVLEGVSGAVYRCIDDLMRMRSALPTPNPVFGPSTNSGSPPSTSAPNATAEDVAAAATGPISDNAAADTPPDA
jgi:E3 ubiquitin-protein ligase synoviolin